ncbi:uracil permease [Babesia caballi]|uniref:Uracil permease n=1 Tax=Babesia caballi TaxID=5871 RepID=A0AAV4M0X7_BABCB|nr:uracil permease [Babesia caballi]
MNSDADDNFLKNLDKINKCDTVLNDILNVESITKEQKDLIQKAVSSRAQQYPPTKLFSIAYTYFVATDETSKSSDEGNAIAALATAGIIGAGGAAVPVTDFLDIASALATLFGM